MANRFTSVYEQKYVPLPFQEIMQAAAYQNKRADENKTALNAEGDAIDKLTAIQGSKDEGYLKEVRDQVHELINQFSTDPKLYTSPNAQYNFKTKLNSIVDPTLLKNIQTSYANYDEDIKNQRTLAKEGKLHSGLIPSVSGYDTKTNGIYSGSTSAYEPSIKTTSPWIQDFAGNMRYDDSTGQSVLSITQDDVNHFVDAHYQDYINTPSFRNEIKIRTGMDVNQIDPATQETISRDILNKDFQFKIKDFEHGPNTRPKATNPSTTTGTSANDVLPDAAAAAIFSTPNNYIPPEELSPILGSYKDGAFTVAKDAKNDVWRFPEVSGEQVSPKETTALRYYAQLQALGAQAAQLGTGTAVQGKLYSGTNPRFSKAGITADEAKKLNDQNAALRKDISEKQKKAKEVLNKLGYTDKDLGASGQLAQKAASLSSLQAMIDAEQALGKSFDLGAGNAQFIMSTSGNNIHNVTDLENPNKPQVSTYVSGEYIIKQQDLDTNNPNMDQATADKLEGQGLLKRAGSYIDPANGKEYPIYSIPVYKKINPSDEALDAINRSKYGDSKETRQSVGAWRSFRTQMKTDLINNELFYNDVNKEVGTNKQSSTLSQTTGEISKLAEAYDPAFDPTGNPINDIDSFKDHVKQVEASVLAGTATPDQIRELQQNKTDLQRRVGSMPPGVRNNNPGNIKVPDKGIDEARNRYNDPSATESDNYSLPNTQGKKSKFIHFSTKAAGLAAQKQLLTGSLYVNLNVEQALRKWSNGEYGSEIAPELRNKTIAYLAANEPDNLNYLLKRMRIREGTEKPT